MGGERARRRRELLAERAKSLNAPVQGPEVQPWHTKDLIVTDPDGEIAGLYKSVARQVAVKIAQRAKDFSAKFPTITVSKTT